MTILEAIRQAFEQRTYLFTTHGSQRAAQRLITSAELETAMMNAEVIEDYPDDKYGPSCLLMGVADTGRVLHVQVSYPPTVKIITVYEPSLADWEDDYQTRRPTP